MSKVYFTPPELLSLPVLSADRSSTPSPLIVLLGHQAPGVCEVLQFGMWSPGEIVTVYGPFPLTAVTRTCCCCARLFRYHDPSIWLEHAVFAPQTNIFPVSVAVPVAHPLPL